MSLCTKFNVTPSAQILFLLMLGVVSTTPAHADTIQMLPPTDFSGNPCSYSAKTYGLLQWDGTSSIKCVPGFYGLATGNIGIGTTKPTGLLQVGEGFLFRRFNKPVHNFQGGALA